MNETYDVQRINRELDRVKAAVFMMSNAAFLGSIMSSLNFEWSEGTQTADVDGVTLRWNPHFFNELPLDTRKTVLVHELYHVARMHGIRGQGRQEKEWNHACDYRINNDLKRDGYKFDGTQPLLEPGIDSGSILAEEEIYELIIQNKVPDQTHCWKPGDSNDLLKCDPVKQQAVTNAVARAIQNAKISNKAGDIPGGVEEYINKLLAPIIPWQQVLMQFFTDMLDEAYTWARPNRRYTDMYLPSRFTDDGKLAHLLYFFDVSASITNSDVIRMNSEVAYIQNTLQPERLSLVQFDTQIQKVDEFKADQTYGGINVKGRGGTSLICVKDYIEEVKPTAAIVFSDLECDEMEYLKHDIPVIWVVVNNKHASVRFGKMLHINT